MGDTYTRQSSYTDGDVITAAHTNDEFNQLLAAFAASSGHTHDGTAAEGGPITKLLGNGLTFGAGTAGTDITITFDGETNDGVLKWMEDEDYFEFSDDILIASTEKIQFRDTAIYINSSADGQLDLVADTEIQIAATTIDINGLVDISGNLSVGGNLDVTGTFDLSDSNFTNAGNIQLDSISGDGDTDTSITFSGSDVITVANAGTNQVTFNDGSIAPVTDSDVDLGTTSLRFKDVYIDSATVTGEVAAASLDISGDIDVDGTSNLDIVDIDGAVNIAADVTIASTNKILFNDASQFIHGSSATVLSIAATDEIDLTATAIDINGTVDLSSTLATGGLYTAGAGITSTAAANTLGATSFNDANITNVGSIALDTITSDATDITVDAAGDIILDAGGANVLIKDDGTTVLDINNASSDVNLTVSVADKNFAIKGTDGASAITALDIDMALAGKATFSGDVVVTGDLTISGDDLVMGTNTSGHILVADGTNFNPTAVGDLSEISTVANDDVFLAVDTSGGGLKKITRSAVVAGLATSSAISNVSEDSTPQLGGNLDLNGSDIVTTSNATLDLAPNGTGTVVVRGNTNSGAVVFNCESNSHGQKVYGQPHSAAVTNTLMLPAGANSTLVSLVSADTLTNKTFGDNTSFGDNNITNVGDIALDSISADGTDINVAVSDNSATALTIKQGSDAYLIIDTANSSESVSIGTGISGTAITLGHSTSEVTVSDNLTVAGDFTVNGTTTTVATTNMVVADNLIELNNGATSNSNDSGIVIERGSTGDNAIFMWDESADTFVLGTTTATGASTGNLSVTDGALQAGSLDISGDIDGANFKVNGGQGSDGQVLTSTGSGVAWEDAGGLSLIDEDNMATNSATRPPSQQSTKAYVDSLTAGNIVATGALNSGSITSGFGSIDNGASAITTTGVITGGTLEATTDTAAGDNAAIGYTAAEGLILTGQGSTSDITLKNDADAVVFTVPTGTDDILFPDNAKAMFGAGSDLQIYHNGSNSYIDDTGTGNLYIRGSATVRLQSATGEQGVIVTTDGAVTLYHNNGAKIATTSTGIDVTGLVEFDSLSGTGGVAITDILDEDDMSSNSATKLATQQSIKAYVDAGGEGSAKAWLSYENQGTASIIGSFNTASVTDNSTGEYTTNYTSAMANTTYNLVGMGGLGQNSLLVTMQPRGHSAPATGSCVFTTSYVNGSKYDAPFTGSACLGDLA